MEGDAVLEGGTALGRALKQARQAAGLSRPQLARLIPRAEGDKDGISDKTIQRWEEGDLTDLKKVRQAEDALELSPWTLLRKAGLLGEEPAEETSASDVDAQLAAIREDLLALRARLEQPPESQPKQSPRRSRAQAQ